MIPLLDEYCGAINNYNIKVFTTGVIINKIIFRAVGFSGRYHSITSNFVFDTGEQRDSPKTCLLYTSRCV